MEIMRTVPLYVVLSGEEIGSSGKLSLNVSVRIDRDLPRTLYLDIRKSLLDAMKDYEKEMGQAWGSINN